MKKHRCHLCFKTDFIVVSLKIKEDATQATTKDMCLNCAINGLNEMLEKVKEREVK